MGEYINRERGDPKGSKIKITFFNPKGLQDYPNRVIYKQEGKQNGCKRTSMDIRTGKHEQD